MTSSDSSDSDEDMMIALACSEIEREMRRPRFWVHNINFKREVYGEFYHLFPDLLGDEEKFFKYFRMSVRSFMSFCIYYRSKSMVISVLGIIQNKHIPERIQSELRLT
nr:unnamed protein product [Callosobruchus analis]